MDEPNCMFVCECESLSRVCVEGEQQHKTMKQNKQQQKDKKAKC